MKKEVLAIQLQWERFRLSGTARMDVLIFAAMYGSELGIVHLATLVIQRMVAPKNLMNPTEYFEEDVLLVG